MRVAIHEAVDKADGVVFRCTLSGSAADRLLEVPAWMFDRARCLDPSRPRVASAHARARSKNYAYQNLDSAIMPGVINRVATAE